MRNRRALLVEDDQDQANLISRFIANDLAMEVDVVTSGADGILAARMKEYSLVLTDIGLPDRSGIDVVRASKLEFPNRPTLVISADVNGESVIEAMRARADDYIPKPLSRADTIERISRHIAKTTSRKVLAVGAHPDDVEIGCGGSLLRHAQSGDDIAIIIMSAGERGGDIGARLAEAQTAAQRLDAQVYLSGFDDGSVPDGPAGIGMIERLIRRLAPDIIYTHSKNDAHQDHRATASASIIAGRNVPNVYCYQSPSTNIDFRPSRFVDVSEVIDEKVQLVSLFQSQERPYTSKEALLASATYWGRFANYRPTEAFEVFRERG